MIKYKWMVEEFIKYVLLKSKELRDCELVRVLCGFSMSGEKDELKKKIEVFENAGRPKCIGEIVLAENSIIVPPVTGCEKLVQNTTNLLGEIDSQYDKLRKQMDNLFYSYDTLLKNYGDIASTFETLESLTNKYNFENNEPNDVRVYEGLKEMTSRMATRINSDLAVFRDKLKNLFKYERENMTTVRDILDPRNRIHS